VESGKVEIEGKKKVVDRGSGNERQQSLLRKKLLQGKPIGEIFISETFQGVCFSRKGRH